MSIRALPALPLIVFGIVSPTFARDEGHQITAAPQDNVRLAQCAQVQPVVQQLIEDASARLEQARQTNNPTALRAAVDDLDGALRDLRAQLAPCTSLSVSSPHAGHTSPNVQQAPQVPPGTPAMSPGAPTPAPGAVAPTAKPPAGAVDPHAGHTMPATTAPSAAPATPSRGTAKPTGRTPAPATATPTAPDPHAGHTMPAPAAKPAAPAKPTPTKAKPSAPDPHAGHATPAAPATPSPASKQPPPAAAKPPAGDPHAGHDMSASAGASDDRTVATDPVCGLKVDPASAPSARHGGQTYYFCSEKHQQLFQQNPAKYLPKK